MADSKLTKSIKSKEDFTVTWELVPGRGAKEDNIEAIFRRAQDAAEEEKVDGITLTDNPGGNPAISAEYIGMKLNEMGIEPLVHFTCKDKSRNEMESFLYSLEREEVKNLLVVTGDYLVSGYQGISRPVFDLDAVQTLKLISELNQGMEYKDAFGNTVELKTTNFFSGCGVSPFKRLESELLFQYYKLEKKIEAGAQFIIPQLGYDMRKFHELLKFLDWKDFNIPVIGNLYVLTYGAGRAMNSNNIPGCVVTDELLKKLAEEREAEDNGHQASLERAAKMYAMMKGMGFAGVHLGGHGLEYEDIKFVIDKGEELEENWRQFIPEFDYPQKDGFYLWQKDKETGLNSDKLAPLSEKGRKTLGHRFFRVAHSLFFDKEGIFFRPAQKICQIIDQSWAEDPFEFIERVIKTISNNCLQCGDCALPDMSYLCPMSQCPKNQRNGACGGSKDGWCEVYPDEQKCIYVRMYKRLKPYGKKALEEKARQYNPPVNWDLKQTSSWLNYFLGRDYAAKMKNIDPPK